MKKINYLFTAILIKSRFAFTRWIILTSFYGITLLLPSLASATNYYIKNTGNDSNTGLSDAQAWKTIAQVNSFIFSPGDSICFLRGNEWRELLRISQSGTDLKRITVTAYGTGAKPIINGADIITGWQETSANIWRVVNPSQVPIRSMVVIDGVLYTHVSTLGELQSANKYYSDITGGYIYVYKTSNPGLGISEISKREYGIRSNKLYITISYLDIRNTGNSGILFDASFVSTNGYTIIDSVNVYRNRISGICFSDGWCHGTIQNSSGTYNGNNFLIWGVESPVIGGGGAGSNNTLVTHCYSANAIHDYITTGSYSDGTGIQLFNSDNSTIEHCISENDFVGLCLDPWGNTTNMICRYNHISSSKSIAQGLSIANYVGIGASISIYYNIFINASSYDNGGITCYANMAGHGNVYVYNNTFYIDATSRIQDWNIKLSYVNNFTFKNNIFYYIGGTDIYKALTFYGDNGNVISDYNQYYKTNIVWYAYKNGTGYSNLAIWAAASGQDTHSQVGNPFFVNVGTDWSLQNGSPCIDKGVDVGLTQDYFGNSIIGLPDIGAIEYSAANYNVKPVISITVEGAGGANSITTDNGTLQLSAAVSPSDATNKTITWSIANGSGQASISSSGLVTANSNGTVTAKATSNDGSGVFGSMTITISNQITPVTAITVSGEGGATTITTDDGTLQLSAAFIPTSTTNKTVNWSIANGITGQASINSLGLVTAIANGTVTARATANDGSGIYGTLVITISNQIIFVDGIIVNGPGGATTITSDKETLQLSAVLTPSNTSNKTVTWSIADGTGQASINSSGFVTAIANGIVTARATANDGSGVFGSMTITISNQVTPVTGLTVSGEGGATTITRNNGTLQLIATIAPSGNTNIIVNWSIANGTGQATINSSGLVTAVASGTVTATATATANDGSGIFGSLVITISNQVIAITVAGAGGALTITTGTTLQLSVEVSPSDAANKTVTWSITNGTGQAYIDPSGLVSAISTGTVTARATANDGSGVFGTLEITILLQNKSPIIHITNPFNGKYFSAPATVNITADAYDIDGNITKVEYYFESKKIGETLAAPYSILYESSDTGTYEIRAIATDNLNAVTYSSPVIIYVTSNTETPELINLLPNPNDGHFSIDRLNSLLDERNTVTINNLAGQTLYRSIISKEEYTKQFDLSLLKSGIYILVITGTKIIFVKEFIKL